MKIGHNVRIAPPEVRIALSLLIDQHGEAWLADHIGCSRPTLARLIAGLGVMPPVLSLAEARLERLSHAA